MPITPFAKLLHCCIDTLAHQSLYTRLLVPAMRDQREELLDTPTVEQSSLAANLADIRMVNRWLGDSAALGHVLAPLCQRILSSPTETDQQQTITLLDVATGSADLPMALHHWAKRQHIPLHIYASDVLMGALAVARQQTNASIPLICHDALHLPYADGTFDFVTCAKALHHFAPQAAQELLRELARVARHAVVVSDLSRSWVAYWGAHALGLVQHSDISRHDGPLSVLRAYTPAEAYQLAQQAGLSAEITTDYLFRLMLVIQRG